MSHRQRHSHHEAIDLSVTILHPSVPDQVKSELTRVLEAGEACVRASFTRAGLVDESNDPSETSCLSLTTSPILLSSLSRTFDEPGFGKLRLFMILRGYKGADPMDVVMMVQPWSGYSRRQFKLVEMQCTKQLSAPMIMAAFNTAGLDDWARDVLEAEINRRREDKELREAAAKLRAEGKSQPKPDVISLILGKHGRKYR